MEEGMKKDRRKKLIIVFAAAAIILPLVILLILSSVQTGTAAPQKQGTKTVQKEGQQKANQKSDSTSVKKTETETEKKTEQKEVLPQSKKTEKMKEPIASVNSEKRQTSSESAPLTPVETKAEIQVQPETKAHVHSYQLSGTKTVEHPAKTKQMWIEDQAAWDEVIRSGYHMSVVTCHQCGAQFTDPVQANALEAWGDHIDVMHEGDGSYDMAASYDVPAETVHHEATGHYEQKVITAAWTEYIDTYRCSCGDHYSKTR